MTLETINLKAGMPPVAVAIGRLEIALQSARARRVRSLKVIHGYGSSGTGGAIKREVQRFLQEQQRMGKIRGFVPGEDFSPFSATCREMISKCPTLRSDCDYSRSNDGITVILLR